MPLVVGQVLHNRYRVDASLDRGGMGAVYRARDLSLGIPVVIKENLIHTPEAQRQFVREASILATLRHPNLPRVTDHFFIADQGQYLIMDYVEGEDLEQVLTRHGRLPERQVLSWIHDVLTALQYLHGRNMIHRDIKPANIRITPAGQVFLVDFGLAKVQAPLKPTTTGARGVTPGYAPPEQYGQGRTDARSDLYSVGATLYALLTGHRPPDGVALMVGDVNLVPPRQVNPHISSRTEGAVLRAMRPLPADRPQTVAEFRAMLPVPASVDDPATAQRTSDGRASDHRSWRAWIWPTAAALVLVLVLLLIALVPEQCRQNETVVQPPVTATLDEPTGSVLEPPTIAASRVARLTNTAQAESAAATAQARSTWEAATAQASDTTATARAKTTQEAATTQAGNITATARTEATREAATAQAIATATAAQASRATETAAMEATEEARPVVTLFEVSAAQSWQATGIQLQADDRVEIRYLAGAWTYWSGTVAPYTGDGPTDPYICAEQMVADTCVEPVPDFYTGALVGRVGRRLLRIGNRLAFTVQSDGLLELRINDSDAGLYDNEGSILIQISVQRP